MHLSRVEACRDRRGWVGVGTPCSPICSSDLMEATAGPTLLKSWPPAREGNLGPCIFNQLMKLSAQPPAFRDSLGGSCRMCQRSGGQAQWAAPKGCMAKESPRQPVRRGGRHCKAHHLGAHAPPGPCSHAHKERAFKKNTTEKQPPSLSANRF